MILYIKEEFCAQLAAILHLIFKKASVASCRHLIPSIWYLWWLFVSSKDESSMFWCAGHSSSPANFGWVRREGERHHILKCSHLMSSHLTFDVKLLDFCNFCIAILWRKPTGNRSVCLLWQRSHKSLWCRQCSLRTIPRVCLTLTSSPCLTSQGSPHWQFFYCCCTHMVTVSPSLLSCRCKTTWSLKSHSYNFI